MSVWAGRTSHPLTFFSQRLKFGKKNLGGCTSNVTRKTFHFCLKYFAALNQPWFVPMRQPLEEKFAAITDLARWSPHRILIGVSGGADSVALLRLFSSWRETFGLKLFAAHANHQLRGEESDRDEAFVRKLCETLDVQCVCERLVIKRTADGLEADARRARYDFLTRTAETLGCRFLALAHHQDDQAETILYRILRGTGPAGLAGMTKLRRLTEAVTLVRPLLTFTRAEILDYLTAIGQRFRTDSSNSSLEMTRNRLRLELLPQLRRDFNPVLDAALVRLGALAGETQCFVEAQAQRLADLCVAPVGNGFRIQPALPEVRQFTDFLPEGSRRFLWTELFRLLWRKNGLPQQNMGQEEWSQLAQMAMNEEETARVFPGKVRVRREDGGIWIEF